MHPSVFEAFERICGTLAVSGRVLEIGASPRHQSLLTLPCLRNAKERIGIGLDGDGEGEGHSIRRGDAHDLRAFADGMFDLVLSNAMLEHDPRFWLSVTEARRVTAPGGHLAIGVPGFGAMGSVPLLGLLRRLARVPFIGAGWSAALTAAEASALTLGLHNFPGDYYRFSEQAMRAVLLEGMQVCRVDMILAPPRIIGLGRKPCPEPPSSRA
jgi:SAM-dependent methyltransferase